MDSEFDIEMHPGPNRRSLARTGSKSLIGQVVNASRRQGVTCLGSRSARSKGSGRLGRGRDVALRLRKTSEGRRVVIKARIVRHTGKAFSSGPMSRHLAYLQREGVTRDQQRGDLFDADRDSADGEAFASRCRDDRHHFRFIISPEDAIELADLRVFTRELILDMARDLGTELDWVGADHWNTDNPHVHVLVRGRTDRGTDLIVDREYIRHGLRFRAEQRATIELGMRSERDIQIARHREITAERWTSLDANLAELQDPNGTIDLRFDRDGDRRHQMQLAGRIETLTQFGLATALTPGRWALAGDAEDVLRQVELRGDIIKSMHAAWTRRLGIVDPERSPEDPQDIRYPDRTAQARRDSVRAQPQDLRRGRDDPDSGLASDGQRGDAFEPTQHRQTSTALDGDSGSAIEASAEASPLSLRQQISADGPTWLDEQLLQGKDRNLGSGFGLDVRKALQERIAHLAGQGLASLRDGKAFLPFDLLDRLRQHELEKLGASISSSSGMTMLPSQFGESVEGTYRSQFRLCAGRFALIDNGFAFQLVPWQPELENHLGRTVSGLVNEHGRVDWTFQRERSIGL